MRTTSKKCWAALFTLLSFCASGLAGVVYDNSFTDLNKTYGVNGVQFGDEINLAGTDRSVTDFQFEYFLSANANGNETARLVLYANDGPGKAPGTPLYTSPALSLQPGFQVAEASGLSVSVPDTLTWAITFSGVDASEVAGLRIYNPPTVGTS